MKKPNNQSTADIFAEDADHFRIRISLESITVYPNGAFEFLYDDGDLFWGHSIMVGGSLDGGLDSAGIHG